MNTKRKITYMVFGLIILSFTACSSQKGSLAAASTDQITGTATTQTLTPLPPPTETPSPTASPTQAPPTSTPPTPTELDHQPAQTPERINFERGATSATLSGHLNTSESDQYVLTALGSQTMTIDLSFTKGSAILAVWGADGTVLISDHAEATYFSGVLPSTQDYYISVIGRPEGSTDYSMKVIIPPLSPNQPTPTPQRINFESGTSSATLVGNLPASGTNLYVLRALKGQTVTVELSFTEGQAILAFWGADGTVLLTDHAAVSHFSRVLPSTQDYYISVIGRPEGSTAYSMTVSIPPLPSN